VIEGAPEEERLAEIARVKAKARRAVVKREKVGGFGSGSAFGKGRRQRSVFATREFVKSPPRVAGLGVSASGFGGACDLCIIRAVAALLRLLAY
jgi:hypothetical protein